jgi:hypothetical protein
MKKIIKIIIIIFWSTQFSYAQHMPHLNFWGRISVSNAFSEKWRGKIELQHRRQNDIALPNMNFFDKKLLSSFRTWVHYQHRDNLSFSFSPFAYYWHNSIILNESDRNSPTIKEIRFSAALDLKHEIIKNLWLVDRSCFEYRSFIGNNSDIFRMRTRLGLRYEFNSKWNLTFFDEIFINLTGTKASNLFDHDRIAFLLNYKPTENLRIETGYIFISRLPRDSDEFLHENNFMVHLYFTIPHRIHSKQPKTQHHT